MALPDQNITTALLGTFVSQASIATSLLKPYALTTLAKLIGIDLTLLYLFGMLRDNFNGLRELFTQSLVYGAYIFLVQQYASLLSNISASFVQAGITAGGGGTTVAELSNPSLIIVKGYQLIGPVLDNYVANHGGVSLVIMQALGELASPALKAASAVTGLAPSNSVIAELIIILIAGLLTMICFFIIGMQLFVIQMEFAVLAGLGIILVPFGAWDKTRFIFDKLKNGIVNFGIKLMLMATLTATCITFLKNIALPAQPTWQQMFYLLLGAAAMAYLAIKVPREVDGLTQ